MPTKAIRRKIIKYQNSQGGKVNKHQALAMVTKKDAEDGKETR